jgi:hypothetical protein
VDQGFFRFFNNFSKVSCELVTEGSYINCSDKESEKVKPKDQGFDEVQRNLWIPQIQLVELEV